jgi:hypothetical protein
MATDVEMRRLSDPSIQWNGVKLKILPNSGEIGLPGGGAVTPVSAGGGAVDIVVARDVSKHIGRVKFSLANTAANIAFAAQIIEDLKATRGATCRVVESTAQYNFRQMFYTGDEVKVPLNADGEIEIEAQGVYAG